MARTIGKLTALVVSHAKRRGYYGDGGGLFLQVSASGSKSWVFRFKEAGRLREMGLGPLHTIGLADARQRAQDCRKLRLDGKDPIEARRSERMNAKVRDAQLQKIPYILVVGDKEVAEHAVSVRLRTNENLGAMPLSSFVDRITKVINEKKRDL